MLSRLENLTHAIDALEHEVGRLRNEFRRRTYAVVGVVAIIAVVGVLIARAEVDSAKAIARNNQRLCPILIVYADPGAGPATSARGAAIQKKFAELAKEFDCQNATNGNGS